MTFSGAILCGGGSTRMGRDKALIPYRGKTLLQHQIATLRSINLEAIYISSKADRPYPETGLPVVSDERDNCGPASGILSVLSHIQTSHMVVVAVDMPHLSEDFLKNLQNQCSPEIGCVPYSQGNWEPLAAVYPIEMKQLLLNCLDEKILSLQKILHLAHQENLIARYLPESHEEDYFTNWNQPEDIRHFP